MVVLAFVEERGEFGLAVMHDGIDHGPGRKRQDDAKLFFSG